jgi:hypothetical protein
MDDEVAVYCPECAVERWQPDLHPAGDSATLLVG